MTEKKKYAIGQHPNSLKQLRPFNREGAIAGQKASVEARKRNKAAREALKVVAKDWKQMGQEFYEDMPDALSVLRIAMAKALEVEDMEEATRLATVLAEFEAPKLQRIDQNQKITTTDLTDEELQEEIKKLDLDPKGLNLH